MPRRRLSEQQLKRIQAIQDRRRRQRETRAEQQLAEAGAAEDGAAQQGRVAVRHGANLAVEGADGQIIHCVSRRHIGDPVCGDRVIWQPTGAGTGVVIALEPRHSLLSRPDGGGRSKPLAANLTQIAVVFAPEPAPAGDLLDQYLIAAEHIGVQALLLCNKSDLLDEHQHTQGFFASLAAYERIGYPLLYLSMHQRFGMASLLECLHHQTSLLVGQSGVGKSSITQALLPDQAVQIGQLSRATGLGRHTTSTASCYRLPGGGHLIDSPGVRSFRLPPLSRAELEQGFREFRPHLGHCRFADCSHDAEPDCAIRAAVAAGQITPERLDIFHRLGKRLTRSTAS
ncbi:ribosome small subunit-dependent GTPase A [Rhabdochromatium marinum]|uniref:ribosome small subunit-dependent GTPase A n=1 Tax=Rhabdochromatium marinum TaxID=48729 RepID=UPI001908BCF9|nr:ribosome small subunit-dependent GTPase A [Rhabdochromatium marinum]MBK1647962.1 ribosome small subunit-dependent GTPase A [Rhabdochromatium marinum]